MLLAIASYFTIRNKEIIIPYPWIFVLLLKFMSTTKVYYPLYASLHSP